MKKLISLILAFILAFACLTALGGCGKEEISKRTFIDSESYYAALADNLAAPVADIDSEAIADAKAGGFTGSVNFSVEGLDAIRAALEGLFTQYAGESAPILTDFAFDIGFVTDGLAASGSLDATLLDETLRMIFFTDSDGNGGFKLPDLLSRPVRIDADTQTDFASLFAAQTDEGEDVADGAEGESEEAGGSFLDGPADDGGFFDESIIDGSVMLRLIAQYSDRFFENLPEDCYSSGKEYFTTADGEEELDCVCLTADGKALLAAFVKTLRELAQDAGLSELFGDETAQVRDELKNAADELENDETALVQAAKSALSWSRFMKDGKIIGDKIYAAVPDAEFTVAAGIDEGDSETFAFLSVVNEANDCTVFSAESRVGKNKGTLDIAFDVDGETYSFSISGRSKEQNGVKTTDADIKVGYGGLSFSIFKITTEVRAFDEDRIDFDFELSSDIMAMLMRGGALKVKLSVDARRVDNAQIETFDLSDAYTAEEIASDVFGEELISNMREKLPKIFEMLTAISAKEESPAQ